LASLPAAHRQPLGVPELPELPAFIDDKGDLVARAPHDLPAKKPHEQTNKARQQETLQRGAAHVHDAAAGMPAQPACSVREPTPGSGT
jgi:hypothetical protein